MKHKIFISALISLIISTNLFAQKDKDHYILGQYKGSDILKTEMSNFNKFTLPLGKTEKDKFKIEKIVEGKIFRRMYKPEKGKSVYEIYKNYLNVLEEKGAKILFNANSLDKIGDNLGKIYYKTNPMQNELSLPYDYSILKHSAKAIIVAKIESPENDFYVNIIIGNGYEPYTIYQLDIIEVKSMDKNMITAMSIKKDIEKNGFVSVYGILFDTGNAFIKKESEATLKEIASFLIKNPSIKVYIVGHTDNVGDFIANQELSENRAKAVLDKLIIDYKVNKDQLKAYGVGSLSPVKSNKSEKGKAKNRRVEIVEQ